jgi:hypothetical protein
MHEPTLWGRISSAFPTFIAIVRKIPEVVVFAAVAATFLGFQFPEAACVCVGALTIFAIVNFTNVHDDRSRKKIPPDAP